MTGEKFHPIRTTVLATSAVAVAALVGWLIVDTAVPDSAALRAVDVVTRPQTPAPSGDQTPASRAVEEAPPKQKSLIQDGMWLVGTEIEPGVYRSGSADTCFWERMASLDVNDLASLLANGMGPNQTVTILASDRMFEHRGCGGWVKIR